MPIYPINGNKRVRQDRKGRGGKEGNTLHFDDWPEIPKKEGSLIAKAPAALFILAKGLFSNT